MRLVAGPCLQGIERLLEGPRGGAVRDRLTDRGGVQRDTRDHAVVLVGERREHLEHGVGEPARLERELRTLQRADDELRVQLALDGRDARDQLPEAIRL